MSKFFKIKKTESCFELHNVSYEFNEHFDFIFISNKKMFFIFKEDIINKENIISHVKEYFTESKCIFLNKHKENE